MDDYLPISTLNKLVYCPRRFWYMYIHGELEINADMLEGLLQHQTRADQPGKETDSDPGSPTARSIHRRIWVWSDKLQIAGFADFVETERSNFSDSPITIPVEYKHGKKGKWDNDNIQLCAQALCLEEMTGQPIDHGEIFYWRSRQRITIQFDNQLRQNTLRSIQLAKNLISDNRLPAPIQERRKCKHCSIQPICLPEETERINKQYQNLGDLNV